MSRWNLRCDTFTVPSGCVVAAPELGLSPVGFPPDPVFPEVGTFLSGRPLPARSTVSCPPPPGARRTTARTEKLSHVVGKREEPGCGRYPVLPSSSRGPSPAGPNLIPCLLLRKGQVCLPGPDGPLPARRNDGRAFDIFDVIDALTPSYSLLYLADLDGLERNDPQLEYIQELSRDIPLWVDSGVRRADQAIDVIVAGAQRAVLSSAYVRGPRELRRAWRLSTDLVFELETQEGGTVSADAAWGMNDPMEIVGAARAVGYDAVVVSPRGSDPDWRLVGAIAAGGPTWVDGTFEPTDAPRLATSGAAGGIFHIHQVLASMDPLS